jgi:hypothetical protein
MSLPGCVKRTVPSYGKLKVPGCEKRTVRLWRDTVSISGCVKRTVLGYGKITVPGCGKITYHDVEKFLYQDVER